jgi:uncharacterized protein YcbX
MGVLAIWRYPVKAMIGELLDAVAIGPGGCGGDRRWVVVDVDTGERIASKRGPTDPRLRACRAELLGRRCRLEQSAATARGRFAQTGAHHDVAPLHLLTAGTLAHLRAIAPESDWDPRRFRPNLLDDGGADAFTEGALIGGQLCGHDGLVLSVGLPTPRCVGAYAEVLRDGRSAEVHVVAVRRPSHVERDVDRRDGALRDVLGVEDEELAEVDRPLGDRDDDVAVALR